ncbi:MAG: hypothetical protein WCC08_22080 [Terrimicrobiaceae bacterium]
MNTTLERWQRTIEVVEEGHWGQIAARVGQANRRAGHLVVVIHLAFAGKVEEEVDLHRLMNACGP